MNATTHKYNEDTGPDEYNVPNNMMQSELFKQLSSVYSVEEKPPTTDNGYPDYLIMEVIDGVIYATPNNENWGSIMAIDYTNKLAVRTGFYDMQDMQPTKYGDEILESEYKYVYDVNKNELRPRFETM